MHSVIKCLVGSICQYSRLMEHESKSIEVPYQNYSIIGVCLIASKVHGVLTGWIHIHWLPCCPLFCMRLHRPKRNYNLEKNNWATVRIRYFTRGAFTAGHPNLKAPKVRANPCLFSPASSNSTLQPNRRTECEKDGTPTNHPANQSRHRSRGCAGYFWSELRRKERAHGCISAPDSRLNGAFIMQRQSLYGLDIYSLWLPTQTNKEIWSKYRVLIQDLPDRVLLIIYIHWLSTFFIVHIKVQVQVHHDNFRKYCAAATYPLVLRLFHPWSRSVSTVEILLGLHWTSPLEWTSGDGIANDFLSLAHASGDLGHAGSCQNLTSEPSWTLALNTRARFILGSDRKSSGCRK